jgi:putative addiction module CopG family antidote
MECNQMPQTITISLDDRQSAFVKDLVGHGRFRKETDVLNAGLELLEAAEKQRNLKLAELEDAIESGLASGEPVEWEGMEAILNETEQAGKAI